MKHWLKNFIYIYEEPLGALFYVGICWPLIVLSFYFGARFLGYGG